MYKTREPIAVHVFGAVHSLQPEDEVCSHFLHLIRWHRTGASILDLQILNSWETSFPAAVEGSIPLCRRRGIPCPP